MGKKPKEIYGSGVVSHAQRHSPLWSLTVGLTIVPYKIHVKLSALEPPNSRSRLIYVAAKVLLPPSIKSPAIKSRGRDTSPGDFRRGVGIHESESRGMYAVVKKPRLILERRQIYVRFEHK